MIRYTTIEWGGCCGKPKKTYNVPVNITPYELTLLIPELTLEDAIHLINTRIVNDPGSCNVFTNQAISRQVRKECVFPAIGSLVTINIPAGKFTSKISQQDADRQAEEEFKRIAQITANQLGTCITPDCVNCSSYRVTRTTECGEYRRDTKCINGQCVDISQEYFICTGSCEGNKCKQPCVVCGPSCPNGSCPQGYNCVNGSCIKNCENAQCSLDCPNGSCQDLCTECKNGKCQPKSCPSGKICQNGICIDKPCEPPCSERVIAPGPNDCVQKSIIQICQNGRCVDSTQETTTNIREGLPCGNNKICRNGVCSDKPCVNQGGSCSSENPCCSGSFCFNGTCISSCPQGYIQQGNTCVVDNRPNVIVNQTVSTVTNPSCFLGNVFNAYGCAHVYINAVSSSINFSNGQSVLLKRLIVGNHEPYLGLLYHQQCNSSECFYKVPSMNRFWLTHALHWFITNHINPNLFGYYQVLLPDVQHPCIQGTNAPPETCTGATTGNPSFSFIFAKMSQNVPNITNLPPIGGTTETITQARLSISSTNPYSVPGYSPNPNTWTGFGFDGNWKTFTLQSNLLNSSSIQGRIVGSELEVRLPSGSPVFGSGNVTNQRLIGTFTVGTIVTTTLQ